MKQKRMRKERTKKMAPHREKILHIIGIGNLTRKDDGVAIHIIQKLAEESFPPEIKITDLGTGGVDIAFMLDGWRYGLILDAIDNDSLKPGEILEIVLTEDLLPEIKGMSSTHGFDVISSLKLAFLLGEFQLPEKIFFFGIQVEQLANFGLTLSPAVEKSVPVVIRRIKELVKNILSS